MANKFDERLKDLVKAFELVDEEYKDDTAMLLDTVLFLAREGQAGVKSGARYRREFRYKTLSLLVTYS